jgi:hypothetical protein
MLVLKGDGHRHLDLPMASTELIQPLTPEFFRDLCTWAVATAERVAEEGVWMRRERLLLAEDMDWPAEVKETRTLHVTPSWAAWNRMEQAEWPNLRLVIVHGGDTGFLISMVEDFLRRWPRVTLWAQNLLEEPPAEFAGRIRVLPIFEQDRRWREGSETIRTVLGGDRSTAILYPFCNPATNPIRRTWLNQVREFRNDREDMYVIPYPMPKEEYEAALADARAVVCPPGNGIDTHRCWETLYHGGWAIVQDNVHTRLLLAEWPDLPLLLVRDAADLASLVVPAQQPAQLHPILFRGWWERAIQDIIDS